MSFQSEDKWVIYVLERIKGKITSFIIKIEARYFFIRNIDFYRIFKDFREMLDCLTIVSPRSHFAETNLISLTLPQSADFVYRLKGRQRRPFKRFYLFAFKTFLHQVRFPHLGHFK